MSRTRVLAAGLVLVAAVCLAACARAPVGERERQPAPALQGVDFEGTHHDLGQHKGSVVVVSAWASWCGPCRDEIPVLARAQQRLGPDGLIVLGLNFRDNPDAAKEFLAAERPPFRSVMDPRGTISVAWGVAALPQSFLLDRDQNVVARHVGPVTDAWIKDTVEPEVRR